MQDATKRSAIFFEIAVHGVHFNRQQERAKLENM
jgi:hypothetical protein